eukprot:6495848-Prorocentrum_lima.AAC.1
MDRGRAGRSDVAARPAVLHAGLNDVQVSGCDPPVGDCAGEVHVHAGRAASRERPESGDRDAVQDERAD